MPRTPVTPYLSCDGAAAAIAFYGEAFGAVERDRLMMPGGRIGHAELEIEGASIMLADEFPEIGFSSPRSRGGSSVFIRVEVADLDGVFARACGAGARVLEAVREADGERRGKVEDPWGHVWLLACSHTPSTPDEAAAAVTRLWEKLDLITPMAIRVAATLRIADHIARGQSSLPALATAAGADADALRRLLGYLTARGVFAESSGDAFTLTTLAAVLLESDVSATRAWADLEGFGGKMDLAFFDLLSTVRTGRPPAQIEEAGLPDAISASFDDVMEAQSIAQAPAIVSSYAWREVGHVVDIGGGTGTQLIALLRAHAGLRGTVVELPRTAARARERIAEAGLAERCEVVAGDLFETSLPAADVYLLKFVLHGLDDEGAARALARCRAAGLPGSRTLVVERTLLPGEDRVAFTSMDLRMLILGEGRERTVEEYAAVAARAGLRLEATLASAAGVHILEFR